MTIMMVVAGIIIIVINRNLGRENSVWVSLHPGIIGMRGDWSMAMACALKCIPPPPPPPAVSVGCIGASTCSFSPGNPGADTVSSPNSGSELRSCFFRRPPPLSPWVLLSAFIFQFDWRATTVLSARRCDARFPLRYLYSGVFLLRIVMDFHHDGFSTCAVFWEVFSGCEAQPSG